MNALRILSAAIFLSANTFAQSIQLISLEPFNKIELENSVTATLTQGTENSISFTETNPGFKFKVTGSTLRLDGVSPKNVNINFQQLNAVDISGVGTLTSTSKIKSQNLKIEISGSGKLILDIDAAQIEADISGVGKLALEGTANDLKADISGSGKINAENLTVKNASFDISGTGNAYINVTDNLQANVTGSGSVYYKNAPANIKSTVTGIGRISKIDGQSGSDTTRITIGHGSIDISCCNDSLSTHIKNIHRKATGHWSGLDIGFNGFMDKNNSTDLPVGYDFLELVPEKSIAVNVNIYDHDFKVYQRYILATTGIGISYNNYRFRKNISLIPDTSALWYNTDSIKFKKNKLTVSYITVPLLITFNTDQRFRKAFHLTTGILLSYKIGSHTKQVYSINGNEKKDKEFDDFNIDLFRYDATVRIGYRNYTVFANYALSQLFKNHQGPELHPWAFGVSLTGW